ncbi:MAG: hypothetical protein ACFCBV_11160, partial [Phycisphaerales bacterium]
IAVEGRWTKVMEQRELALAAIEKARGPAAEGGMDIDNPLDAGVTLPNAEGLLDGFDTGDLADLLGVSLVEIGPADAAISVTDRREEPRCERSWKRDGTVRERGDGGLLSDRDAEAVGAA